MYLTAATMALLMTADGAGAQTAPAKTPYWASISKEIARMRKGPSPDVPVKWEYRRRDLPVKVVAIHENWRKVRDPDGEEGWMNARLLSRTRTAIITGTGLRPMREAPNAAATIAFRAEPGVVGRITDCANGWCLLDVKGRRGWVETAHIWGDEAA